MGGRSRNSRKKHRKTKPQRILIRCGFLVGAGGLREPRRNGTRVAAPSGCIVPWAARASCWPQPQQLLPVSAAGSGRRCCTEAFLPAGLFGGSYELRLPLFPQPFGRALKKRSAAPASPPCFRRRRRSAPLLFESTRPMSLALLQNKSLSVLAYVEAFWWARVDCASRASKKAPQGLFYPPDCSAGRCCSNPPLYPLLQDR